MSVISKPVITEKYTALGEDENKFAFICDVKASKEEIKKEVETLYNVTVEDINTMIYPARKKMRYTRSRVTEGKTKKYKKAVVTLKDGDTIDFYSNI